MIVILAYEISIQERSEMILAACLDVNHSKKHKIYFGYRFESKTLSKSKRKYCVTLSELLVVIKGVEHFHKYLYGRKFLLSTDHGGSKGSKSLTLTQNIIARLKRINNAE